MHDHVRHLAKCTVRFPVWQSDVAPDELKRPWTAEIIRLADWDTTISNFYARKVIQYLLGCDNHKLSKEAVFAFEKI